MQVFSTQQPDYGVLNLLTDIIFRMRQKTLQLMQYMGLMVDLSDILEENDNNVIQMV